MSFKNRGADNARNRLRYFCRKNMTVSHLSTFKNIQIFYVVKHLTGFCMNKSEKKILSVKMDEGAF